MHTKFIQGFLVGQLLVVSVIGLLIWYFFIGKTLPISQRIFGIKLIASNTQYAMKKKTDRRSFKASSEGVDDVASELDSNWIDQLLKRIFMEFFQENRLQAYFLSQMDAFLQNNTEMKQYLGSFIVREFFISNEVPQILSVKTKKGVNSELFVDFSLAYEGLIVVGFDAEIFLNWPVKELGCLPVTLVVNILRISATLSLYFPKNLTGFVYLKLEELPDMDIRINTILGAKKKLYDPAKLEEFIVTQMKETLRRRLASQSPIAVAIPSL